MTSRPALPRVPRPPRIAKHHHGPKHVDSLSCFRMHMHTRACTHTPHTHAHVSTRTHTHTCVLVCVWFPWLGVMFVGPGSAAVCTGHPPLFWVVSVLWTDHFFFLLTILPLTGIGAIFRGSCAAKNLLVHVLTRVPILLGASRGVE